MKIEYTKTQIRVKSTFNANLPKRARAIGGDFKEDKTWVFDIRAKEQVIDLYKDIYGEWDEPSKTTRCTIRCHVNEQHGVYNDSLYLGGKPIARAFGGILEQEQKKVLLW
jgi:hypothetical protein